ncbi:MAG TPA: hypothetical protein VGS07_34375 [Thermoanaerobaculia bacterium]|jgi:hypothetical protein|nr:hypothetical protein [Thermoanaerobaculia bacterium]
MTTRRLPLCVLALGLGLLAALPARAHQGPPFPILVDRPVGPYLVSVWTDPDIGTGTFYVILDAPAGKRLVNPTRVRIGVRPVSGRLPEVLYDAEAQSVRHGARYYTTAQFDRGEMWHVRCLLDGPQGGGELKADVEATPDGTLGPLGSLIYLVPFLGVGGLWLKAVLFRRKTAAWHED